MTVFSKNLGGMALPPLATPMHHYFMHKNSRCIETEQSYHCRVHYFNRQNLMLVSQPKDWATAYGTY